MYVNGGLDSYDHTQTVGMLQTKFNMYFFKLNQLQYPDTLIILLDKLLYITRNANHER